MDRIPDRGSGAVVPAPLSSGLKQPTPVDLSPTRPRPNRLLLQFASNDVAPHERN